MRFGIVGAGGYWGPNWVRVLRQLDVLGAVCDVDAARLQKTVDRFELRSTDVQMFDSYEKMLAMDLSGVFVVTPPHTHAALAIQALQAGRNVFVEKPLADDLEKCYKIKFEAERLGRTVMVGHTFIYHPAIRKFKESLSRVGALRTIFTVRAHFGRYQPVGIVYDLLPHDLSIFNFMCDGFPQTVRAETNPSQDVAFVTARYGNVCCNAFLSWGYPERTRKLVAVGDQAMLEWDLSTPHLMLHRKYTKPAADGRLEHLDEGTENISVFDQSEPLMNQALHFIACIRDGTPPLTGVEDGINVVKGLEQCR